MSEIAFAILLVGGVVAIAGILIGFMVEHGSPVSRIRHVPGALDIPPRPRHLYTCRVPLITRHLPTQRGGLF